MLSQHSYEGMSLGVLHCLASHTGSQIKYVVQQFYLPITGKLECRVILLLAYHYCNKCMSTNQSKMQTMQHISAPFATGACRPHIASKCIDGSCLCNITQTIHVHSSTLNSKPSSIYHYKDSTEAKKVMWRNTLSARGNYGSMYTCMRKCWGWGYIRYIS